MNISRLIWVDLIILMYLIGVLDYVYNLVVLIYRLKNKYKDKDISVDIIGDIVVDVNNGLSVLKCGLWSNVSIVHTYVTNLINLMF